MIALLAKGVVEIPKTIAAAQLLIDRHVDTSVVGRCVGCGEFAPCRSRSIAHTAFRALNALPQRRPRRRREASGRHPLTRQPEPRPAGAH